MKRFISLMLCLMMLLGGACLAEDAFQGSDRSEAVVEQFSRSDRAFPYRFADREEAVELYLSNTAYFAGATPYDLQFRLQRKDATAEMLMAFGAEQMMDFTEKEKAVLVAAMEEIEALLKEKKLHLPQISEITFIRSTQAEEPGSAYTRGTQIYMDGLIPTLLAGRGGEHQEGLAILVHELFHCLTRNAPDFRRDMYRLIGFQIVDQEFDLPAEVRSISVSNPDVERHDAYAEFTIDGEKRKCTLVLISKKPFERPGDSLNYLMDVALVPVETNENGQPYYLMKESEDYRKVFGTNTDYVIDPEECMADNFSYALVYGPNGSKHFPDPELLQAILELLQ